jgi:hypothetical protein
MVLEAPIRDREEDAIQNLPVNTVLAAPLYRNGNEPRSWGDPAFYCLSRPGTDRYACIRPPTADER